jgi:tetratricopeptide (TPR) repeat protein
MVPSLLILMVGLVVPVAAEQQTNAQTGTAQGYYEFMLARHLESKGDTAGALEALKRAQAADPKSADIQAEFAAIYARQNDGELAVAAGEKALTMDPANIEAHRILGMVYSAWSDGGVAPPAGRTPTQLRTAAIEHLTKVVETPAGATDLNMQLTLGRLHLRAGRADRAIPILENIVSQAPFAAEPYSLLAEARMAVGRTAEAIQALEMAAEISPRNYLPLAELYEKQGKWEEAATAYAGALAAMRNPSRDLRLRWIAALLNSPGKTGPAKARDALKEMLVATPQDARTLYLMSLAHRRLGDLPAAEDAARKMLAVDAASLAALSALSGVLLERGEFRQVVDLLTPFSKDVTARSKGREENASELLTQLAHAHSEMGQHAQAVSVFSDVIKRDPLNAPALNSLGYLLADRGERLPEAVGFIERALKIDPENPSYLDSLGWALFKQGKVDEAVAPLRKAADALADQSIIHDHLGDALARTGKFDEAIAAWQRALSGDGQDIVRAAVEKKIRDAKGRKQ